MEATSEPVVLHHGRQARRLCKLRGAAACFNSLLGGLRDKGSTLGSGPNSLPDVGGHS